MADVKKKKSSKSTAKKTVAKKSAPKKVATKKTVAKKSAPKKTSATTTKKITKTAPKKVDLKKKTPVKSDIKNDVSKTQTKKKVKKNNSWVLASIVLGVIVVLLIAGIGYLYFDNKNTNNILLTNVSENGTITLTVITDKTCDLCFADEISNNFAQVIPNLEIKKYDITDSYAKDITSKLETSYLPLYMFSEEIATIDMWNDPKQPLSDAFDQKKVDDKTYYTLKEEIQDRMPAGKIYISDLSLITQDAIILGEDSAPVTIVQFTDFECPACAIAAGNAELIEGVKQQNPTYVAPMPKIYEEYVETGKVKVVFYNYPLLHPTAKIKHEAVLCANDQDRFKEYENVLWKNQIDLGKEQNITKTLKEYAKNLSLDETKFNECLDSQKYSNQIDNELEFGKKLGVYGTPGFFIDDTYFANAYSYEYFKAIIDAKLEE